MHFTTKVKFSHEKYTDLLTLTFVSYSQSFVFPQVLLLKRQTCFAWSRRAVIVWQSLSISCR